MTFNEDFLLPHCFYDFADIAGWLLEELEFFFQSPYSVVELISLCFEPTQIRGLLCDFSLCSLNLAFVESSERHNVLRVFVIKRATGDAALSISFLLWRWVYSVESSQLRLWEFPGSPFYRLLINFEHPEPEGLHQRIHRKIPSKQAHIASN